MKMLVLLSVLCIASCSMVPSETNQKIYTDLNNELLVTKFLEELKKDPHNTQARYKLVNIFLSEYFFDDAIAQLREINKIDPHDVLGYQLLALVLVKSPQTDYLEAIQVLKRAVKIAPQRADLFIQLALLYSDLHKTDSARLMARQALNLSTEESEKATIYLILAQMEPLQAQQHYQKAQELDPSVSDVDPQVQSVSTFVGELPMFFFRSHPTWADRLKKLDLLTR